MFEYKLEHEAKRARLVEIPEQQEAIKEMVRLKKKDIHSEKFLKL